MDRCIRQQSRNIKQLLGLNVNRSLLAICLERDAFTPETVLGAILALFCLSGIGRARLLARVAGWRIPILQLEGVLQ